MGNRIRTLPDRVANQIAAGEAVERPASVIKELIENAIDAGATRVSVSFRNGGKSYIEVTDDGSGMVRHDALLSFERHATSKIRDAADLRSIATLGFRGEALASIASVSRLTLSTYAPGEPAGVEVIVEGGKLKDVRDCAPIKGARVQVSSLFFNIPARRKFLRSENVEATHSQEAVIRQALGSPGVGFRLDRDGKPVFSANGGEADSSFERRIEALFGRDTARRLTPVDFSHGGMSLTGFISRPGTSRANRDNQYIFINGRYVRDRLIASAIADGYRSLLPRGRHPELFLRFSIPPDRVDVNVSPTKIEVRFVDGGLVARLVTGGVMDALRKTGQVDKEDFAPAGVALWPGAAPDAVPPAPGASFSQTVAAIQPGAAPGPAEAPQAAEEGAGLMHFDALISDDPRPIGQVFTSFILLEDGDRLLLLDQHTVHERINYESLTLKYREGRVDAQELLFPVRFDLSKREADHLRRNTRQFERLGFFIEEFGGESFTLRSAPTLLLGSDYQAVILDILDTLSRAGKNLDLSEAAEAAINIMACRGAVMAGQTLGAREIESLVGRLKRCALPYTCPHGRPVALTLEKNDLLRGFARK